ncbi:MAG: SdrD B-like domain-containing protein [Beutenbergiaceae bacterium]
MAVNFDGTGPMSDPDYDGATDGSHTPGLDANADNRVVRTWDQYGYTIDYDVNEDLGTNVVLTVSLSGYDQAAGNIAWNPSAEMVANGRQFTGCLDGSSISTDGLVLTCLLGDVAEGTHGTIRPTVALRNGVDTHALDADVLMTADGSADATSEPETIYVSEAPSGNWIKNTPVVTSTRFNDGYLVMFPIGLTTPVESAAPPKGSGRLDSSADLSFTDHFWENGGLTTRYATAGEIADAVAAGESINGDSCGSYDGGNGGRLPVTTGDWTCGPITTTNGYPAFEVTVAGGSYSNTQPDLDADGVPDVNANGTPNSLGYILTGQVVLWMDGDEVDVAMAPDGASFTNSVTSTPSGTAVISEDVAAIEVIGSSSVPEGSTGDNSTRFAIGAPVPPGGGAGAGPVSYTSHYGLISSRYVDTAVSVSPGGELWDPANPSIYAQQPNNLNSNNEGVTPTLWDGRGEVSRGQPLSLQMLVGAYSNVEYNSPIQGCMVWDAEQLSLAAMPDFSRRNVNTNIYSTTSWSEETPTHPTDNLVVGVSNNGSVLSTSGNVPRVLQMSQADLAAAGVQVQYAADPTVMDNPYDETSTDPVEIENYNLAGGAVAQGGVECNDAGRTWVNAQDVDPTDGTAYNMVRVIMTGDEFPWYNHLGIPSGGGAAVGMEAGMYLSVQVRVGTDLDVNRNDKAVYIHTARAVGAWDSGAGRPTGSSCFNLPDTIRENRDYNDPGAGQPSLVPGAAGWCNLGYDTTLENAYDSGVRTTLDQTNFTYYAAGDVTHPLDSDTDRVRIVTVRPSVTKTNVNGPFDVADNGDQATFRLDFAAIGSDREALVNVTARDVLRPEHQFVSMTTPSTPGATCTFVPDVTGATGGAIECRFSAADPDNPDPGQLVGLPGGQPGQRWQDSIEVTVQITGAVAVSPRQYTPLTNTADVYSGGYGAWDPAQDDFLDGAAIEEDGPQTDTSTANTYMPLPSDAGAIVKAIDAGDGPCTTHPNADLTGAALEAWQQRCSLIGYDDEDANMDGVDADGNVVFSLTYNNVGNTRLSGLRIVDVFPFNGDGPENVEPASDSANNGVTLGQQTNGDGRSPASSYSGSLGFVSLDGASQFYVSGDAPNTISRDPDAAERDTVWCDAVGGAQVMGPAGGTCPQNAYEVTAVFAVALGSGDHLRPDDEVTLTLTLDTENAQCDDFYTNTFGARTDQMALPIRSNDVSAMVRCPRYSLGNEVWFDTNNNGQIDDDEDPIGGVEVLLFNAGPDGQPIDTNGDGLIDAHDAIATDVTDADGLYLFGDLNPGDYVVGIAPSNWEPGGPLASMLSSDPTETDPNLDVDNNDNGFTDYGMVVSGPVTLGRNAEPLGENPDNDDNADERSNLTVDFGFHLPQYDLALRKVLSASQSEVVELGQTVTFDIIVFNQGDVTANQIEVTDYIPVELELNDPDWTAGPDRTATIRLPGSLAPGGSVVVQIDLKVIKAAAKIDNYAEISDQTAIDEDGHPITTPIGTPIQDIDSVPDQTNDDVMIDDEINLTPQTGDEDDHDIASITMNVPPLVPPSMATTGAQVSATIVLGGLLLLLGSAALFIGRRRWRTR